MAEQVTSLKTGIKYKDTPIGKIPVEWEVGQVSGYGDIVTGNTPSTSVSKYYGNEYPFASPFDLGDKKNIFQTEKYLSKDGLSVVRAVPPNSILVVCIGSTTGKTGVAGRTLATNQQINSIICKNTDSNFVYYYLTFIRKTIRLLASTQAVPILNKGNFSRIKTPIPPVDEQKRIGDVLSSVDDAIEKTNLIIEKTKELKRGLMQRLLTRGIGHTKFKKTEIGELPEEWEVKTLQAMIDQQIILGHLDGNHGSLYPRQYDFSDKGILYLAANCLVNGQVDFKVAKHITTEKASTLKKGFAKDLDVLFAHNATVGPVSVLRTNKDFVILSTSLTYYRSNRRLLNPFYLYHYMDSEIFEKQYKRIMEQTTRNQVPITTQRKLCHLIPPKIEQDRIAEILSELDTRIREELVYKSELDTLKKGLMQVLLTGKLRVAV